MSNPVRVTHKENPQDVFYKAEDESKLTIGLVSQDEEDGEEAEEASQDEDPLFKKWKKVKRE